MGSGTGLLRLDVPGRRRSSRANPLFAQWSEARADFFCEDLRLFPSREVAALAGLVVVDEVVVCALGPAARGLIALAGEGADGRRDENADGVVQADLVSQYSRAAKIAVFVSQ
jgi:hypothetical protein